MFQYLSDLLYLHDCLIVPGFGAFVGNPVSAELKESDFRISPPGKQIAFNISIQSNDGLLANYISRKEGLSYAEANKKIIEFTESVKEKLKNRERVVFSQIGFFYMDAENNLQFEADASVNYSGESFGLASVQCVPVYEEVKPFVDRPAIPAAVVERKAAFKWKRLVIVPVVAATLWVSYVTVANRDKNANYSFLNPFEFLFSKDIVPVKPLPAPVPEIMEKLEIKPAVLTGETAENSKFFVIAGCFSDYNNALSELNDLKSRGYDARFLGKHKGLHVVCYHGYTTRNEAEAALSSVREHENVSAWILKKK